MGRHGKLREPKGSIHTFLLNLMFSTVLRPPHSRHRRREVPSGIPFGSLSPPWDVLRLSGPWCHLCSHIFILLYLHVFPGSSGCSEQWKNTMFSNSVRWDLCVPAAIQGDPQSAPRGGSGSSWADPSGLRRPPRSSWATIGALQERLGELREPNMSIQHSFKNLCFPLF